MIFESVTNWKLKLKWWETKKLYARLVLKVEIETPTFASKVLVHTQDSTMYKWCQLLMCTCCARLKIWDDFTDHINILCMTWYKCLGMHVHMCAWSWYYCWICPCFLYVVLVTYQDNLQLSFLFTILCALDVQAPSSGVIAGIIVGCLVVVLCILSVFMILLLFLVIRKRRHNKLTNSGI